VPGSADVVGDVSGIPVRRITALRALWRVLAEGRRPGAAPFGDRFRALPRMAGGTLTGRYPVLSRGRLAMLVLAVAYLVSPVDLVPEAVLGPLGLGDDALVAAWLAGAFLVETDRYLSWERSRPLGGFLDDH
jgi:uncharacterized membrane protein YkvA (DUF1232 family)